MPEKKNKNLALYACVVEQLDRDRDGGTMMTNNINAALYWFFNRLDAHQRDNARREALEWAETGVIPSVRDVAEEAEEAVRVSRKRESGPQRRKSKAAPRG